MLDLRRFIPVYRSHLLALHARLGQITRYGNSAYVPPEEHFWAVGLNLFRGYRYIEAGTFNFVWNIEYRFPLAYGMRCVAFSDIGQIAVTRHDFIKHTDLDVSFGLGLRYPTPLGPVRLDFGVPLLHGELGFSKTILQFGLGQAF
jgi:outer membrane protein assembly factor BamA